MGQPAEPTTFRSHDQLVQQKNTGKWKTNVFFLAPFLQPQLRQMAPKVCSLNNFSGQSTSKKQLTGNINNNINMPLGP